MTVSHDTELLTIPDAAARLTISRSAMYVLIARGEVETVQVYGTRKRVLARSLDEYVERQRRAR